MTDICIRPEVPEDVRRVYEVEAAAFGQTLQADIVEVLRSAAEPQLSLVAVVERQIVGHVFFSPATIDCEPALPSAQLSPLAIDPSFQGQGVGSALVREGLERCRELGWALVFLLGDPRYYSRFGFSLAAARGFTFGDPRADAALQIYEVLPGAARSQSGRVRFHAAFEAAEPQN